MNINGNEIKLANGKTVNFSNKIWKVIQCDQIIVVLTFANKTIENNVFGLNLEGQALWQIENLANSLGGDYPFGFTYCEYSGIDYQEENKQLTAYNTCGFLCVIDTLTGKILHTTFTK